MTTSHEPGQSGRRAVWAAGLIVATGAGVATAHGLYQVAAAARVPAGIAWLYPLITDGLALVAYAATARLHDGGRRYAGTIVVLAAGLSGLAQATYLTGSLAGSATAAPAVLRFGVGAWPAIAAALTAHLLHLIGTDTAPAASTASVRSGQRPTCRPIRQRPARHPTRLDSRVQPSNPTVQHRLSNPTTAAATWTAGASVNSDAEPAARIGGRPGRWVGSARDRALAAARSPPRAHGTLPTVTELAAPAGTSRGTAGTV